MLFCWILDITHLGLENVLQRNACWNYLTNFDTAQKTTFSIKDFFGKCDQIRRKLQIWSQLLKKSLMENFIFCAVWMISDIQQKDIEHRIEWNGIELEFRLHKVDSISKQRFLRKKCYYEKKTVNQSSFFLNFSTFFQVTMSLLSPVESRRYFHATFIFFCCWENLY